MTAPYPSPETAARMIAEEISACRTALRTAEDETHMDDICRLDGMIAGLERAAWLLNVEELVVAELEES